MVEESESAKTSRICIIGDSHASALKFGWDRISPDFPDIVLTFFAAGGDALQTLEVSSRCLISKDPVSTKRMKSSSGGDAAIGDDYDAYMLCGMGFQIFASIRLGRTHRIECSDDDGRIPISDECFQWTFEDVLRATLSIATLLKLRTITTAPIIVVAAPLRCEGVTPQLLRTLRERGEESKIAELAIRAARRISKQYEFSLVLQPEMTLATPLTTDSAYGRSRHERDSHMNELFGEKILRAAFANFLELRRET